MRLLAIALVGLGIMAGLVCGQIVARGGVAVAIVPDSANVRAMADLNRIAEW